MVESYTGLINTNNEFVNIETLTDITFTVGNTYTIQTNAITVIKILDSEIEVFDHKPFQFCAGENELYIKTDFCGCKLTILENEEQGA